MRKGLGEFEQLVLFALLELEDAGYGLTVKEAIEQRTERSVSVGAVYTTLDRLEIRGLITSRVGEPTPQRGGRRKKCYSLTPAGADALKSSFCTLQRMSEGLLGRLDERLSDATQ